MMTVIVTFAGIGMTTPDLVNEPDYLKSKQQSMHLLESDTKGHTFSPNFLNRLFAGVNDESSEELVKMLKEILQKYHPFIEQNTFRPALNSLIKLSRVDAFANNLVDDEKLNFAMLTSCDPIIKKDFKKKMHARYFLIDKKDATFSWEDATRMVNKLDN